jgi:hypothetical protein
MNSIDKHPRIHWLLGFLVLALPASLGAVEINGTVRSATDKYATIVTDSGLVPTPGDKVTIFFKMPGADEEVSVASGHVVEIVAESINVQIDNATGEVAKDQLARITSANPRKRSELTAAPSVTPSAMVPRLSPEPTFTPPKETGKTTEEPPNVGQMASQNVTFDAPPVGLLAADAFATQGLRFVPGKGRPLVVAAEPNMILPRPCTKVMLVGDTHVTSFTLAIDPPVKRFALYRIGTANGASTPTWKMMAYNRAGKLVGSTGEIHGLPKQPMYFGIDADNIARVEISTDNRQGTGTWATWSSLPIAGFGFDR